MEQNTFKKFTIKLFAMNIGLHLSCVVAAFTLVSLTQSPALRALLQAVLIIVSVCFVYSTCHKVGDKDAPLVTTGYKKYSPLKGLWAGLVANSPFLFSGIVLLFSKISGLIPNFVNYYKIINAVYFPFLYSVLPVDHTIKELSLASILISVAVLLIIPVLCMFSYMLGLGRFSFNESVFYKKKA